MSIAGVSSNFSALSTADAQAEVQYSEDAQLLAQTPQIQSLQSPALLNPALSETADLLNSAQPSTLSSTANLLENASSTAAAGALAALDQDLTSAPGQPAGLGIAASSNTAGAGNTAGTNNSTNGSAANPTSDTAQPGPLQSLIQEIQQQAQQAYTATQQGYAGANTTTTVATG